LLIDGQQGPASEFAVGSDVLTEHWTKRIRGVTPKSGIIERELPISIAHFVEVSSEFIVRLAKRPAFRAIA
jgi:hypothetical protein